MKTIDSAIKIPKNSEIVVAVFGVNDVLSVMETIKFAPEVTVYFVYIVLLALVFLLKA